MQKAVKDLNDRSVKDPTAGSMSDANRDSQAVNPRLAQKLIDRKYRWEWNLPLGLTSIAVLAVVFIACFASYRYHSVTAADTFLQRANDAVAAGDFNAQIKWLRRYTLLKPNDADAIVQLGIAAHEAVNQVERSNHYNALTTARKELSSSIARLGQFESVDEQVADLRARLIEVLLDLGGAWFVEAEQQVLEANAEPSDAKSAKWLALALYGQVLMETYKEREPAKDTENVEPWKRFSKLPVGEVFAVAVDRNPDDLEVISPYIIAFASRPELFDQSGDRPAQHQQRVDSAVVKLIQNEDSRSKLVLYSLATAQSRDEDARKLLFDAAGAAVQRLKNLSDAQLAEVPSEGFPDYVWDYQLLAQAAQLAVGENPAQASEWYETLITRVPELVPGETAESVFAMAGRVQVQQANADRAVEIWEQGLEQVNSNSLELLGTLAAFRVQRADDDLAAETISRYRDAVDVAARRLAADTENDLSIRTSFGRRIQTARWRLKFVDGLLALRDGDEAQAIRYLDEAVSDPADVPQQERLVAAIQLAETSVRNDAWDRAADAFDAAVELDPNNELVRMQAAEAWTRAGNRLSAMEHWRILGTSRSVPVQIASADALIQYQMRLVPEQRDFSGVRSAITRIEPVLRSAMDSADQAGQQALLPWVKRFDALKVSLPPPGVMVEDHLESKELANDLASIAEQYADDAAIQALAAERLAAAGLTEQSNKVLDQLATLVGEESTELALVRARIESAGGNPLAASKRLAAQAQKDPDAARRLLQMSASFALNARNSEVAYAALLRIPEDQRRAADLFDLARIARSLPPGSKLRSNTQGDSYTAEQLDIHWEGELRKLEGDQSTFAAWLQATRIINEMQQDPNGVERGDPRIAEVRRLARQILSVRPRWGEAISLEGWLLGLEKRHEQAITQLRRGIAAGDKRVQTQMQLLQQLLAAGRDDEAEQQMRLTSFSTDMPVDQYGETRIALAAKRGDLDRALDIARSGIEERPDDYLAFLVLARTAIAAAGRVETEKRQALFDEARTAIDNAAKVAGSDQTAVFGTSILLATSESNLDRVSELQQQIAQSGLDKLSKALLQSRCYIAIKEYDLAEEMLLQADSLQPTEQTQILLVELYRLTRDTDAEIAALRKAQQRSPENAELRAQLARALVVRDGKEVDWREIEQLLADESTATSANRLLYAMMMGAHGNPTQQGNATRMLRELVAERNQRSDDAARLLAVLLRKQLDESSESAETTLGKRWISEIRTLYESLTGKPSPEVNDLYRYGEFLLSLNDDSELPKVDRIVDQLGTMEGGAHAALDLGVRHAKRSGEEPSQVVNSLAETHNLLGAETRESIASAAGASLIRNGFVEEGLDWFAKAYRDQPERMLATYVVMLNRVDRVQESVDVCLAHYEKYQDTDSAVLLSEALMKIDGTLSPQQANVIESAVERFNDNVQVFESVATLHMIQEDYAKAIPLFERITKLDPFRIRALNNLAMAYSEIPGQAAKGIDPINRAIKIAGEAPELLDTKGTVLLKAGQLDEALRTFREAVAKSDDPRFQFHVILVLLEQQKAIEAERAWKQLDLDKLNPAGLTAAERRQLEQMKKDFSKKI